MAEHPFLQGLTPAQNDLLAPLFVPVEWIAHELVFRQGEVATFMYLLIEGGVSIRYKPYDGPQLTLTRLHAGDVFGWSAVVGNAAYTADAVVTSRARALRAPGADIRQLCLQQSSTGAQILEKLALAVAPRWRDAQEQVKRLLKEEMLDQRSRPATDVSS
jgi:CRP-like cAMP-binding protein